MTDRSHSSPSGDLDDDLGDLDGLLRCARPAPSPTWESELGGRLLPRQSQRRRFGVAVAAATGLAGVAIVAGLAGGGPLAPSGGDDARARPGCTTVYVTQARKVGQVVRQADGSVTVEATSRPVIREQQRCANP